MAQDLIYKLKTPVTIGSETTTEVTIRQIKGKHLRALPADPKAYNMGVMMDLAAKVMGESSVVLDEMDSADLMEVIAIVGERIGAGQPTGASA